jgi:hypothetical protein
MNPLHLFKKITEARPDLAIKKNSRFVYKSGADVLTTWKKTGWTPPTEYRTDYEFGKKRI